jgi:hypothetical protein
VGVQDPGQDGPEAEEEDVEDEKAEEEDRELRRPLRLLRGELCRALKGRREVHQGFGEDDPEEGHRSEGWQYQGEDGVGEALGVFFAVGGYALDEERDKGRVEDAAQEELVDQVSYPVGGTVGVRHHPGPQHCRHDHRPQVSRGAREGVRRRHREHGSQDG